MGTYLLNPSELRLSPTEGPRVFIPVINVPQDGSFEPLECFETAPADRLSGDQGKPALDQIEPRGTGRREVKVKVGMRLEPLLDLGMLVRAVVVADEVQFAP